MPKYRNLILGVVALLSIFICHLQASASRKPRPMTVSETSGAWLGISEDQLYYLRIALGEDGRGAGSYSYLDSSPVWFEIQDWTLKDNKISIAVVAQGVDSAGLNSRIEGTLVAGQMDLVIGGVDWARHVFLLQEEVLLLQWKKLKEEMDRPR